MALVKALIVNLDVPGPPIPIMFNPEEYSISKSVNYKSAEIPGKTSPLHEYGHGYDETLSMDLFFDTYETGLDVRFHTEPIAKLLEPLEKDKPPPVCLFAWGTLTFRCRLQSVTKKYTMFNQVGIPVRATLSVSFLGENVLDPGFANSPVPLISHVTTHAVKEGDTLRQIAWKEYKDASKWRMIAKHNKIENPLELTIGQLLEIPTIS